MDTENKNADYYIQKWVKERKERWLNFLCGSIIKFRKPADELFVNEVYELFCKEKELISSKDAETEKTIDKTQEEAVGKKNKLPNLITLLSLTHLEGVNALKQNETINFHPKLTVIYGRNGAGKSGYIRILKKASNSKTAEDIWSNISVKKEKNNGKAKFALSVDNVNKDCEWCGEELPSPFEFIKIFDGKCIPIYLNEKIDFSLTPYGLELFSFITDVFTEIKQRLEKEINNKTPQSNPSNLFSDGTKVFEMISKIDADTNPNEIFKQIENIEEIKKESDGKREEYKRIVGIEDRLKVLQTEEKLVGRLSDYVEKINSNFNEAKIGKYIQEVEEWKKQEKEVQDKSLTDFSKFGVEKADSDEWHNFISSAEKYIKILEKAEYPSTKEKCIYCNQELSKEAVKLIQKYNDYINSTAEKILQEIGNKQRVYCINTETLITNNFEADKKEFNNILGEELSGRVFTFLSDAKSFSEKFIIGLKSKDLSNAGHYLKDELKQDIEKIRETLKEKIKQAESDKQKFNDKLRQLGGEIKNIEDLIKLDKYKNEVESYIEKIKWIKKANNLLPKLNTQPVTVLQKKAWKELVSDGFEAKFKEECKNLSTPSIELSFPAEYGVQKRAKSFEGLKNIGEFLSEGEQRSVALADFFAETETDCVNAPVIFDDPVNSMDDIRRERLAKRIYEESQKRQVIVFTHDVLFLSYLYDRVYDTKKDKIDSNLAVFHWAERDGDCCGKITEESCPRIDRLGRIKEEAENAIKKAENSSASEREYQIEEAYSRMREMLECIVAEKFFKGVVERWSERMRMHNLDKVILDSEKYKKTKELFEEFSGYMKGHSHSTVSKQDFPDLNKLKKDFEKVNNLYI